MYIGRNSHAQRAVAERSSKSREAVVFMVDMVCAKVFSCCSCTTVRASSERQLEKHAIMKQDSNYALLLLLLLIVFVLRVLHVELA